MNIWINKNINDAPINERNETCIFNINSTTGGTVFSSIKEIWLRLGSRHINPIYEDFFMIGLAVFAVDKRISRAKTRDRWTRDLKIFIPILKCEIWDSVKSELETTLNFLTGDHWELIFRPTTERYADERMSSRKNLSIQGCNGVSLFSGGLDSFCGALRLLEDGNSICFVGHNEYPQLGRIQSGFIDAFQLQYPEQVVRFMEFTAGSRAPQFGDEIIRTMENTSRSRSLLFISAAVSIAGLLDDDIPVFIPENGFIGINVPLTSSRMGTCSTRTTHPYYIKQLNSILRSVGINNKIENFFAYNSKREIVQSVNNNPLFREFAGQTISCSHPCLPRWNQHGDRTYPKNCGYCYPCLIRKSSLHDINVEIDEYVEPNSLSIEFIESNLRDKPNDVKAIIRSIYRFRKNDDSELARLISCTGPLEMEEIDRFLQVYRSTIQDLINIIDSDAMLDYVGVKNNEQTD